MATYDNKVVSGGSIAKMKEWIDGRFEALNAVDVSQIQALDTRLQALETVFSSGEVSSDGKQGWSVLPNGMKIMWWSVSLTGNASKTLSLPYSNVFTNKYTVIANSQARIAVATEVSSGNTYFIRQDSTGTYIANCIAIGR